MTPWRYGNYVILERLGAGGMSEVDLARQVVEGSSFVRFVVIKRIKASLMDDPAFVRMFMDEARITSELHHARIAQVYDFGKQDDEYYMALEYVPGLDIRRIINVLRERGERLPFPIALRLAIDVLEGLEYAHAKQDTFGNPMNIVHRDVNPRNVMVSTRGEVKLIDFGVAKATGRLEETRADLIKGKFAYMAPEQIKGDAIDHRADLFAMGLTLHELLTGYGAFYGLDQIQIMHRLVQGQMPKLEPIPELDDDRLIRKIHAKSLQTDPDKRYQNARDFRADLIKAGKLAGGIPSRKVVAEFVEYVQPGLRDGIQTQLAGYNAPVDMPAHVAGIDPTEAGSLSGMTKVSFAQTGVFAGGLALVAMGAIAGGALVVAVVLVLFLYRPGASEEPVSDAPHADQIAPPPATEVAPRAAVAPQVDPSPAAVPAAPVAVTPPQKTQVPPPADPVKVVAPTAPSRPHTEVPQPALVEPSEPEALPVEEPEPPAPEVGTAEPEPPGPAAPAAEVALVPQGYFAITSTEKGRAILIDGKSTGLTTPQRRLEWPSGAHTVTVEGYAPQQVNLPENQVKMISFR
ncbi:MAG: protein kinase [Deltaproteobacteria bacterium]|nr:protein kinase [Deltaproteobacteria bacterium]